MSNKFKIDSGININNRLLFEKYGFNYTIKYKCLCCGKPVTLAHFTSNKGDLLICNWCAYKYFGGVYELVKWRNKNANKNL